MRKPHFLSAVMACILTTALILSGCATTREIITETETGNKNITVDNLLKIEKGVSNTDDIRATFGEPNKISENPTAETKTWTYLHTKTQQSNLDRAPFQIDQTQLDLIFNKEDVVIEYIQTISNRLKKDL